MVLVVFVQRCVQRCVQRLDGTCWYEAVFAVCAWSPGHGSCHSTHARSFSQQLCVRLEATNPLKTSPKNLLCTLLYSCGGR